MLNKILLVIALGVFAGLAPANAQTAPAAPTRVKGRIIATRVVGHVDVTTKADGLTHALKDGEQLSEQTQVVTAVGASVILVFSNGATINMAGDSTLDIEQFVQDPFSGDVKVADLKAEPSATSITRLNLTKGELVGKVVHLNVDKGSEFTVQTPVGAAGIRGTTFRIVFRPGPGGKAFFVITTADGRVLFRGITSTPVSIPAGKQVVATFDYTPPSPSGGTTGGTTGGTPGATAPVTTPVTIVTTDTPPAEAAQIQVASQAIVNAVETITLPASNSSGGSGGGGSSGGGSSGGGSGGGGSSGGGNPAPSTNNTPSNAGPPAPALSPGVG
ncbi:MAG: FecR domain-containing protein [Opitutaceae bacterium]|jgi:uncharacterized membrane protein YgcG